MSNIPSIDPEQWVDAYGDTMYRYVQVRVQDLDLSQSNLWVIIHRARLQLRHCLEENWLSPPSKEDS